MRGFAEYAHASGDEYRICRTKMCVVCSVVQRWSMSLVLSLSHSHSCLILILVHFDGSKDLRHEPETRVVADAASDKEEGKRNHRHVAEVQHARQHIQCLHLGEKVECRVGIDVQRGRTRRKE